MRIFKQVEYPENKESIEHIIKEYDKRLNFFLNNKSKKSGKYVVLIMAIIASTYVVNNPVISMWLKSVYVIPCNICCLYNIYLDIKSKKNKDKKSMYKLKIVEGLLFYSFLYIGTIMIELMLFGSKWDESIYNYLFLILAIISLMIVVLTRIEAPRVFINSHQFEDRKLTYPSSIVMSLTSVTVSIAYVTKPYKLVLVCTYLFLVLMAKMLTYNIFVYSQYDKIEELKRKINYIPKDK